MPKKIDLTNQTFGDWTVLREATKEEKENRPGAYWLCQCKCGLIKIVNGQLLRNGSSKSCGCGAIERIKQKNYQKAEDLTGQIFGKLTVLERIIDNNYNGHQTQWRCLCECGKETIVGRNDLINQKTKSCGCLRKQQAKINMEQNREDLTINEIGNVYGKLTVLFQIPNNHPTRKGAIWHCKCECGNEKDVFGADLRKGTVSSCGCIGKSKGEWIIEQILQQNQISFGKEYRQIINNKNMRFDFIINSNSNFYFIEFDGDQHFQPSNLFGGKDYFQYIKEHDELKNQWCKDNNIPLIRIPYTHLNDLCLEDLQLETSKFIV